MIFGLLTVHNHDRMPSNTQVLHIATWNYFTICLPDRFSRSPKVLKEAIMTDINDFVQEFWSFWWISSDENVVNVASFYAMRCLLEILQKCFDILKVCFAIISFFATAIDLTDNNLQMPNSWFCSAQSDIDDRIRAKFKILFDGYRKMFDQSLSKSIDLGDMLKFLPGVVVQKPMSVQGMADLYRIKPDLLEHLINPPVKTLRLIKPDLFLQYPTIKPLRVSHVTLHKLDGYLSGFLQDRDRSQLYYCDPMLQHISICRHFLSLLDGSNAFNSQS